MKPSLTRRSLSRLIVGGSMVVADGVPSGLVAAVVQADDTTSGGLGLTREEFEAIYGPGQAGQSFQFYTDPATGAEIHAGLDDGIVDYFWLRLGDERTFEGIAHEDAWTLVSSLLPGDVRVREEYLMNETPGSLGQVETVRLTSRWLDEMLDGRSSILASVTSYPGAGGGIEAIRGSIQVARR